MHLELDAPAVSRPDPVAEGHRDVDVRRVPLVGIVASREGHAARDERDAGDRLLKLRIRGRGGLPRGPGHDQRAERGDHSRNVSPHDATIAARRRAGTLDSMREWEASGSRIHRTGRSRSSMATAASAGSGFSAGRPPRADRVDYAPSQEVAPRFPEIPPAEFRRAFQLVLPDGRVFSAAEAVFATLAQKRGRGRLAWAYAHVPGFAFVTEAAYRLVASHRNAADALTRLLWGRSVAKPTYAGAAALFVRLLGLCYFAAFVSFWVQSDGLVGAHGILPIAGYLDWVQAQTGAERYFLLPTLTWLSSSDAFLRGLCAGGTLASLLLAAGWLPCASAITAWILLSLDRDLGTGLPGISVGLPAARGGVSRHLARLAAQAPVRRGPRRAADRGRTPAVASLPADVLVGMGQARERRSELAPPLGAALPLRDAAPAALDRLVHAPDAVLVPDGVGGVSLLRRARRAVPLLRAAPPARLRVLDDRGPSGAHRGDGELRVLQPARGDPRGPAPRRSVPSGALVARRRGRRRARASVAAADPRSGRRLRPLFLDHRVRRHARPRLEPAGSRPRRRARGRSSPELQRVWPLHGHDDHEAGDRGRGEPRRNDVASLRVSMEARRSDAPARLRGAAPAPARLADVVRGSRRLRAEPLGRAVSSGAFWRARPRCCGSSPEIPFRTGRRDTCGRCSTTIASPTRRNGAGPAPGGSGGRSVRFLRRSSEPSSRTPQTPNRSALQARPSSPGGAM